MKKYLVVLSVLMSFVVLGCSNPTSSSNSGEKPKEEKPAEEEAPAEPSEEVLLLREIRDSLKKTE